MISRQRKGYVRRQMGTWPRLTIMTRLRHPTHYSNGLTNIDSAPRLVVELVLCLTVCDAAWRTDLAVRQTDLTVGGLVGKNQTSLILLKPTVGGANVWRTNRTVCSVVAQTQCDFKWGMMLVQPKWHVGATRFGSSSYGCRNIRWFDQPGGGGNVGQTVWVVCRVPKRGRR